MLQADLKSFARLHGEIEEREAKIRRLVNSNIIGIFVWDFEGRILDANDEFLRMVNYDREDLVAGRIRWADLTPTGATGITQGSNSKKVAAGSSRSKRNTLEKTVAVCLC